DAVREARSALSSTPPSPSGPAGAGHVVPARGFVISGPGGGGKDTIVARLLDRDDRLELSRSWTTRPQRPGEADDAYTFVDRAAFEREIAAGRFLEWAEYLGNLYRTPLP